MILQSGKDILEIKAFVGGYMGPSYQAEINLKQRSALYKAFEDGYVLKSEKTINLSDIKIEELLDYLEKVKIFNWKSKYDKPDVLDGTNWSVEIVLENDIFHFSGSNAFPKKWGGFCRSIEKVLGKCFG